MIGLGGAPRQRRFLDLFVGFGHQLCTVEGGRGDHQQVLTGLDNEFTIRDILKNHIRKLSKFSINVTFKDMDKLTPNLKQIRGLKDMFYLPFGSHYFYSADYGLKKDTNLDITDEVFD